MSEPPPDQRSPRSHGNNPAAEYQKRIADTFDSYARQHEAAEAKNSEHNRNIGWWTRRGAIAAWIYTAITALIFVLTIRSVQEAGRAVDAATFQASVAKDTEIRQLRAYVFVDDIWLHGINSSNGPETYIRIKNSGVTPSYGLINGSIYTNVIDYPLKQSLPVITFLRATGDNYSFSELGPRAEHPSV
jgi:hypothetical protein